MRRACPSFSCLLCGSISSSNLKHDWRIYVQGFSCLLLLALYHRKGNNKRDEWHIVFQLLLCYWLYIIKNRGHAKEACFRSPIIGSISSNIERKTCFSCLLLLALYHRWGSEGKKHMCFSCLYGWLYIIS